MGKTKPRWKTPSSWVWTTVDAVGTVRLGRQRSPDKHTGLHATKYIRAGNIVSGGLDLSDVLEMDFDPAEKETYVLKLGDVVLAEASGSPSHVGRAALWNDEIPGCCFQNTVIRFRPHAVVPAYAILVFRYLAQSGAFASAARGVGIQHLGTTQFASMGVPIPPMAEQTRIAHEASTRLRHGDEAQLAMESALKRTLQQDNAILEAAALGGLGGSDGQLVTPALSPEARPRKNPHSLFPGDSEPEHGVPSDDFLYLTSQKLPPGWRWIRIDEAGDIRLGRQRSPQHEHGGHPFPYLRVANVLDNRIDTSDVKSMNFTPAEQKTYRLIREDILVNEGQSPELVGRPAMYRGQPERACYQNSLIRFRATDQVNSHFALLIFRHYLHDGHFTRAARWSTNIAHLGVARFGAMPFPLPPLAEQGRIVAEAHARLRASETQRHAIQSSLAKLEDMRKGILREAVSGLLVAQCEDDEPAVALLARLGPPIDPRASYRKEGSHMARRSKGHDGEPKALVETLISLKGPVPPERLFDAAGYDRDSAAHVEAFYVALRQELGKRIRQRTGKTGPRLEVISHASR